MAFIFLVFLICTVYFLITLFILRITLNKCSSEIKDVSHNNELKILDINNTLNTKVDEWNFTYTKDGVKELNKRVNDLEMKGK